MESIKTTEDDYDDETQSLEVIKFCYTCFINLSVLKFELMKLRKIKNERITQKKTLKTIFTIDFCYLDFFLFLLFYLD